LAAGVMPQSRRCFRWLMAMMLACIVVPASAAANFVTDMRVRLVSDAPAALAAAQAQFARTQRGTGPDNTVMQAEALWVQAQAQFRLGDATQAQATLRTISNLALVGPARRRMRGNAQLLHGLLARQTGDFPQAMRHYRAAQTHFLAARDRRGQGQALQALGVLYNETTDVENAHRYLRMAAETYADDDVYNLSLNNNRGVAYNNSWQPAQAALYFSRAATYADRLGIIAYANTIRMNVAIAQVDLRQYAAAAATLRRIGSVEALPEGPMQIDMARIHALLALRTGDVASATRYIDQLMADVDPAESGPSFRIAHLVAYQVYEATGRHRDALTHLEATRRLEEEGARLIASNRAALLAAQFGYDAQNARIDRLKAQQLTRSVAFERQRADMQRSFLTIVLIATGIALTALVSMLVISIRARNRARRDEAQLAVANVQLQHALSAKSEFLASTSHEMRTPLNGIVGMSQILLADQTLSPRMRGQIELVHTAGTAMRGLVDDLLDVAKIEHGGFSIAPQPVRIAVTIAEVIAQFQPTAALEGLTLQADITVPDEDILLDAGRVRQIIVNLVGNAIKFTERGGVHLVVRHDRKDADQSGGGKLKITVSDTGMGIAPEWQDKIFEMFQQVDGSRTRSHGGTGLGLAITRQLARAMGGDVFLKSTSGQGSSFQCSLPYQPVAVTSNAAVAAGPAAAEVMIVGANPLRIALLSNIIGRTGKTQAVAPPSQVAARLNDPATRPAIVLIDAAALPVPDIEHHPAWANGVKVIVAGDPADGVAPSPCTSAICVPFALNALLPLLREAPPISDLHDNPETPTVANDASPSTSRVAGAVGFGG
jgi:signal transduction histidine kinase